MRDQVRMTSEEVAELPTAPRVVSVATVGFADDARPLTRPAMRKRAAVVLDVVDTTSGDHVELWPAR